MAKGQKPKLMDPALEKRLDDQDAQIQTVLKHVFQAMDLIKGSSVLNYPGIIDQLKKITEQLNKIDAMVQHMERWRQIQIAKKGTFTFRTANLFTQTLSVIGGAATVVAIIYTIIQIVEHIQKL
jgi:hypothetical protein